jgi:hypothetical protein
MHLNTQAARTSLLATIGIATVASLLFLTLMAVYGFAILLTMNGFMNSDALSPFFAVTGIAIVLAFLLINGAIVWAGRRFAWLKTAAIGAAALLAGLAGIVLITGCAAVALLPATGA